jgi:fructose-bisphosphate aldolase class II
MEKPEEFDPRKFMVPAMEALEALCLDRYERFGCAGQASKIRVLSLDAMAARYAGGELDPRIEAHAAAA